MLDQIIARYKHILVVEINDEGLYGFGQLATLLRSRYCNPAIASITKTDGRGNLWLYEYDVNGMTRSITAPDGANFVETYGKDAPAAQQQMKPFIAFDWSAKPPRP